MHIPQFKFDDDLVLFNLGDVHRAAPTCDVKAFHKVIEEIHSNPKARWVSTGDLAEVPIRTSKTFDYRAKSLGTELELLEDELEPIAPQCLGFTGSNHHNRLQMLAGLSLDKYMAKQCKLPFLGITGVINITCGACSYYICMHHGVGSGTMGNKINRARILAHIIPGADVYMTGHTHSYACTPLVEKVIDRKRGLLREFNAQHVTTGHFLKWDSSYAEGMLLEPMPVGSAMLTLHANDRGNYSYKKIGVDLFS
jgi:hypothetical protein